MIDNKVSKSECLSTINSSPNVDQATHIRSVLDSFRSIPETYEPLDDKPFIIARRSTKRNLTAEEKHPKKIVRDVVCLALVGFLNEETLSPIKKFEVNDRRGRLIYKKPSDYLDAQTLQKLPKSFRHRKLSFTIWILLSYFNIHPRVEFTALFDQSDIDRHYKDLVLFAKRYKKLFRLNRPSYEIHTSKLLDSKEGICNLGPSLRFFAKRALKEGYFTPCEAMPRSRGKFWDQLTTSQKEERLYELISRRIGFPKVILNHAKRGTLLEEILCFAKENYKTENAFRDCEWSFYKFLYNKKLLTSFREKSGMSTIFYSTSLATGTFLSEPEAIVAAILGYSKINFQGEKPYGNPTDPHTKKRLFRSDFFLIDSKVHLECWMFMKDTDRKDISAFSYLETRHQKTEYAQALGLRVLDIEVESTYRNPNRSDFVNYAANKLRNNGVSIPLLSDEDINTVICSVKQALDDTASNEAQKRLISVLKLLGVREECAFTVTLTIHRSTKNHQRPALTLSSFVELPSYSVLRTIFNSISINNSQVVYRPSHSLSEVFKTRDYSCREMCLSKAIESKYSHQISNNDIQAEQNSLNWNRYIHWNKTFYWVPGIARWDLYTFAKALEMFQSFKALKRDKDFYSVYEKARKERWYLLPEFSQFNDYNQAS